MNKVKGWFLSLNRPLRLLVAGAVLVVLLLGAVTVSATTWEYTNSPEFCGTVCHTMPPEYIAYQVSPHARVACVDCHLGQDSFLSTVPRKAREVRHVVNALTQAYEPPIYVKSLRPARDTCEKCHNPDKFSSDSFVELKRYAEDETNTLTRTYLVIKTGGGTRREGLGRGIHWHVENEVWFYATDHLKQTIPYVREVTSDGNTVEYFDVEAGLPPDFGQQVEGQLQRMDCIDCHTRISHLFRSPANAMDTALARQQIDRTIPVIKEQGVQVLSKEYTSPEEGLQAVASLESWYQENYPDYYAGNQAVVQGAVAEIKNIFTATVFPNMGVGWQTHPNNAGHKEFPGCFRCHDGKHTSPEGQTVRLECNVCHSIPEVVEDQQSAPVLSLDKSGEPESHLDSNWLARHRYEFNESCAACHDVGNPGGTDNTSFCANSACHATEWKFVGLDAPAIRELVEPPVVPGSGQPEPVPHPIGPDTDCTICHASDAVRPWPTDHASFTPDTCTQCHQPPLTGVSEGQAASGPDAAASASLIPHPLEGRNECLACHGADAFKPYPADHVGRPVDSCLGCHQPAIEEEQEEEAAPEEQEAAPDQEEPVEEATEEPASEEKEPEAKEPEEEKEESSGPPQTPHTLEGREDCLICHGADAVQPFPIDHVGRPVATCLGCHKPAE